MGRNQELILQLLSDGRWHPLAEIDAAVCKRPNQAGKPSQGARRSAYAAVQSLLRRRAIEHRVEPRHEYRRCE